MAAPLEPANLVVIGASAGGIPALSTLVSTLPANFAAPILIAQHLDPARVSHLQQILAAHSILPVRTVSDHAVLEPGVIFVVPSNRNVEVTEHDVRLWPDPNGPRPSVDLLFHSAAQVYGDRLIGVVLTGSGSDGAADARAVKKLGGTVVIQDPRTASFPSMPLSLAPTTVDIVLPIKEIGPALHSLTNGGSISPLANRDMELRGFMEHVRERIGIDFSSYKTPTMERRLQRRLIATGMNSLEEYVRYLESRPEEYQRLISTFLVKVTEFFRDSDVFNYLRDQVLPGLIQAAKAQGNMLRAWSAGCATGEEAYSLAILIVEMLGSDLDRYTVRIFATDLDVDAIAFARRGVYPASALTGLAPELVDRHFTEANGEYTVKKQVRSLIIFGPHDLGQRPPFPSIDLVLCRNVLIYFTPELQRRALQIFGFALRTGGTLVLGKAETTNPLPEYFALEEPRLRVYRRYGERILFPSNRISDAAPRRLADLNRPALPVQHRLVELPRKREPISQQGLVDLPSHVLLRMLSVGVVLVDSRYDIQAISGAARRYFGIHTAGIGEDFLHLVQNVPALPLRRLIDAALEGEEAPPEDITSVDVATSESRVLRIFCRRHANERSNNGERFVVVEALDITDMRLEQRAESDRQETALAELRQQVAARTEALEESRRRQGELADQLHTLGTTNRRLQQANEELATINASVLAENEEFILDTEEAQAATEEVETLNEELQATNEELETLNEELQSTIEELHTTNEDLEARNREIHVMALASETERARLNAILTGLGDAVLVVDRAGRPLLVNAAYTQQFGDPSAGIPAEADDGRTLPASATPAQQAARGETFVTEFALTRANGTRRWFEAHGRPVPFDRDMQGVVVLRDVTERSLRHLQQEFMALASHELSTPLTVIKGMLQLLSRTLAREGAAAQAHKQVATALGQVDQLASIAADLLDLGRLQTGNLRVDLAPLDLRALAGSVVDLAQPLTVNQTIRFSAPDGEVSVRGDAGRMQQVLLNLLTNAMRYAPDSLYIDVRLRPAEATVELEVQDYGPGIPAEDLPRLFSRFTQLGESRARGRNGLGLGLYLSRQIITAHGGTIEAASPPGGGALFMVRLPAFDASTTAADGTASGS